jgi:cytochrome P450
MTTIPETKRPYDSPSVAPLSFWASTAEEREKTFKILRDERPVSWHPPLEASLMAPEQEGIWAVVRHEDIVAVSKDPQTFCSGQGTMVEEIPQDILEASMSFLNMDAAKHTRLRRLVSSAFTPRRVAKIEEQIKDQARQIVDDLLEAGGGDFVELVSHRLPMWTLYEMLGLPPERREAAAHAADAVVGWNDEAIAAGREPAQLVAEAMTTLLGSAFELIEERRTQPADDLMTSLIQAEVDGDRLTDDEIAGFFHLLSVAGNDTTRNTTSIAMKALCDFPDQRKLLMEDFDGRIGTAIDEFVRWASPVMTFRRTVTRDTELHGQKLRAGDWVAIFYPSGNRDERVFKDPYTFDILRSPNPHLGFGGGGPHFCLGSTLARTQLRSLFRELLHRAPNLQVGEPTFVVGNFVHSVSRLPCTLG